jgi:hypothetical protein
MARVVERADAAAAVDRATSRNDALINHELIRLWLLWGLFWTMLAPTVGVIVSTKFNYPDFLGTHAWSTRELQYLIAGQFVVATLMALGALCLFTWAALAGLLRNVQPVKRQVLEAEGIDDDG